MLFQPPARHACLRSALRTLTLGLPLAAAAALAGWGAPALAQYKVVKPDGTVTYTDRPPTDGQARVTPLGSTPGAAARADAGFPLELRQAAQRYPVTLYTAPDCAPCDSGRQWLAKRGVPYTERSILTQEDQDALQRQVGSRSVPALTVGVQPVRGFSDADWSAYMDAAGYPRESRLPRGWQPPPVAPLVSAAPRPAAEPPAAPARRQPPQTPPAPPPPPDAPSTGIRF